MSALLKPSWFSYALTGVLALMASWALSGCRFGNQVVDQPQVTDGVSGYYETAPQTLRYCASVPSEQCADAPTNLIPQDFSAILTNPVILKVQDTTTGKSILFSPYGGDYGIPIFSNPDQSLTVIRTGNPATLWDDAACTREDQELIEGAYAKTNGPWTSNTPSWPKSGRINLKITYVITIAGTCTASLQAMADCFGDPSKCGTHQQSEVQTLFSPYINATTMGPADITKATGLAYEITYQ